MPSQIAINYPPAADMTDPEAVVQVDLLGTSVAAGDAFDLDVAMVADSSIRFGPDKAGLKAGTAGTTDDHDGDGLPDKHYSFRLGDTGITCDDVDEHVLTSEVDPLPTANRFTGTRCLRRRGFAVFSRHVGNHHSG